MAVYENSRYLQTTPYERSSKGGITVFKKWDRPRFNMSEGSTYEWKEGDTLDGLAFQAYENSNLWWVILVANPEYRTEYDIKSGDMIFIPDFEEVCDLVNVEGGDEEDA